MNVCLRLAYVVEMVAGAERAEEVENEGAGEGERARLTHQLTHPPLHLQQQG